MVTMPGKVHKHKVKLRGKVVSKNFYHRVDGAWLIHGVNHSEYTLRADSRVNARTKQTKEGRGRHRRKPGYPHTGDKKGSKRKI